MKKACKQSLNHFPVLQICINALLSFHLFEQTLEVNLYHVKFTFWNNTKGKSTIRLCWKHEMVKNQIRYLHENPDEWKIATFTSSPSIPCPYIVNRMVYSWNMNRWMQNEKNTLIPLPIPERERYPLFVPNVNMYVRVRM